MNRDEYNALQANLMTEKQLQSAVMDTLRKFGWRAYHTFDSRRSGAGFPDIIAIRGDTGIAIELKRQKDKTKPERMREQHAWLTAFDDAGFSTAMYRPSHWLDGTITRDLA